MGKYDDIPGLSEDEVKRSRDAYGANELPEIEEETFWDKLWENFEDPLIKILMVALVITLILAFLGYSDWFEAIGIGAAVFLATFVATYSEHKNESSFRALQAEAGQTKNQVFRSGKVCKIGIADIVIGDFVLLQSGDKVPADGPVVRGSVAVNQASLNGEPDPFRKTSVTSPDQGDPNNVTDPHFCFRGSVVEQGEGVMLVKTIGKETQYGKIIEDIEKTEERDSPLKVKLEALAETISTIGYIGATGIFISFLFKQFIMDQGFSLASTLTYVQSWEVALQDTVNALILAIIIIVVAVPEGLPMMIAIVLSINMQKLLDHKVLVRKLSGIETAGSLNVLFTDKTGTLTKGQLAAHEFFAADLTSYRGIEEVPEKLRHLLKFTIKHSSSSHIDASGSIVGGNASDKAFLEFINVNSYATIKEEVQIKEEVLFSSTLKLSAASVEASKAVAAQFPQLLPNGKATLVKGAPEKLLESCRQCFDKEGNLVKLSPQQVDVINEKINNLSRGGVRVIAIAASTKSLPTDAAILAATPKPPPKNPAHQQEHQGSAIVNDVFKDLHLIGLVGLRDEIRPETPSAVKQCKNAHIQVVMITGDRKETAISIATEVGLLPATDVPKNAVLESEDIQKMSDEQLQAILPDVAVVSRALPTDKSRLIHLCQKMGLVVGMTGDGVNDAAALNRADVGFGMGSGTEMAKEASDIVIMDDNFHSITRAILYGRTIFRSIRKFIIFQSTINVASTLIVFLGPFLGFDFPLTLIQLLWVNLVMDTLAALAFGGEPALESYMDDTPVQRTESIISPYMWSSFLVGGIFISICSIYFLLSPEVSSLFIRNGTPNNDVFLTAFFSFYIFITTVNAFNVRTTSINIFDNLSKNRGFLLVLLIIGIVQITFTAIGGKLLRTVPLLPKEWGMVIKMSLVIIPFDTLRKLVLVPFLPVKSFDPPSEDDEDEEEDQKDQKKDKKEAKKEDKKGK